MTLVTGKAPAGGAAAGIGNDGQFRVLGYTLNEWNEIIHNIQELIKLRGPAPAPAPRAPQLEEPPLDRAAPLPPPPPPVQSAKCDLLIIQLSKYLDLLVQSGNGGAKLYDILQSSNMTLGQLNDIVKKAIE